MKRFYFILFFTLATEVYAKNCLPKFEITDKQLFCSVDSDCTQVGDACRSCGTPYVANRKFKEEIEIKDRKARESAKCVLVCEACSHQSVVECKSKRCQAVVK